MFVLRGRLARHGWAICVGGLMSLTACDDATSEPGPVVILDGAIVDQFAPDAAPDAQAIDAAVPDAAPDMAPGCGAACAQVEWSEGPALPAVSDHHTTFVHADGDAAALFVVGGIATDTRGSASTVYPTIQRAEIAADGRLMPFVEAPIRLPFDLAFQGQARRGDRYYLTGGVTRRDGQVRGSSRVVMLEMGPGPSVARAVDCGEMVFGVIHPTAAMLDDVLYVIGGSQGPPIARVQRARIGDDGCPTDWAEAPRLPESRSHHAAIVVDGQIILLGGFGDQNQEERPTILRSTLDADGQLSGWAPFGELDPVPWTASALHLDDALWLIGGGVGSVLPRFSSTVQRAAITDDGVGPFEEVDSPLPFARSHVHQTPFAGGFIYSAGGRILNEDGMLDSTSRSNVGRLVPGE